MTTAHTEYLRGVRIVVVVASAALGSCGGSSGESGLTVDDIVIIPPIPGQWTNELGEEIEFFSPFLEDQYFSPVLDVVARVRDPVDLCGATLDGTGRIELEGTIDGDALVLYLLDTGRESVCLRGRFTDLVTLDAVASDGTTPRTYRNVRVEVRLNIGLWASDDGGKLRLIFQDPNSVNNNSPSRADGCIVVTSETAIRFDGTMLGFDTDTDAVPRIDEIRSSENGELLFSDVSFVDRNTLTLVDDDEMVTLHRVPLPVDIDPDTLCPFS